MTNENTDLQPKVEEVQAEKTKRTNKKTTEKVDEGKDVEQTSKTLDSLQTIKDASERILGDGTITAPSTTAKTIKVFKLNEHTQIPAKGTQDSACFDIRVNLLGELESGETNVTVYTKHNQDIKRKLEKDENGNVFVELRAQERLIAPTGAIFDIPQGYSLKIHPRSGTSLKQGINLINQEAVIDSDFVDELKLLLVNSSESYVKVYHGERYAQGELEVVIPTEFEEITERPQQKTDRTGGLGHTGTK